MKLSSIKLSFLQHQSRQPMDFRTEEQQLLWFYSGACIAGRRSDPSGFGLRKIHKVLGSIRSGSGTCKSDDVFFQHPRSVSFFLVFHRDSIFQFGIIGKGKRAVIFQGDLIIQNIQFDRKDMPRIRSNAVGCLRHKGLGDEAHQQSEES